MKPEFRAAKYGRRIRVVVMVGLRLRLRLRLEGGGSRLSYKYTRQGLGSGSGSGLGCRGGKSAQLWRRLRLRLEESRLRCNHTRREHQA